MAARPFALALACCAGIFTPHPVVKAPPTEKAEKKDDKCGVEVTKDVKYRTDKDADKVRNALDVYVPKGKKDFPVVFFVHGGAWQYGSKDVYAEPCKRFAESGLGVVSVNYRLAPKAKHPAQIEDVASAFAWTVDHVGEYGGDPKKIVLMGHSAGGHLVALLATDEGYLKAHKRSFADIRGVVGISGVYNIDYRVSLFHSTFGDTEESCTSASPIKHVGKGRPPMTLVYGDKDMPFLDTMAEDFAKALTKAKSEATAIKYKDRDHIGIVFDMKKADDPAFKAVRVQIEKWTKD